MEDLVKLVADKTGISPEQAKSAVETVMGFVKEKLPAGMSEQVEAVMSGKDVSGGLASLAGSIKDKLGL
ncbi:MAG TPA: DUF2267 domain-containing protein [Ignavibacteria bacterium]|nr:DUF2267 domain-containing protein [Ignavibacteria bacterium]